MATSDTSETGVPLSDAQARLSGLARRVRPGRERAFDSPRRAPEAVLLSLEELKGLEMPLETLGASDTVASISESLTALGRGERGTDAAAVLEDLTKRSATGA